MARRIVEVFSAGCPLCEDAVEKVKGILCSSCELRVLDMRADKAAQAKAEQYGVTQVPAVAVNGNLADCCRQGGIDLDALRALGVGQP